MKSLSNNCWLYWAVFQPYCDLEAGDNQSLKFKWESNPGPLAPQAKSLTTRPPPLPLSNNEKFAWRNWRYRVLLLSFVPLSTHFCDTTTQKFSPWRLQTPYTENKERKAPIYIGVKCQGYSDRCPLWQPHLICLCRFLGVTEWTAKKASSVVRE